MTRQRFYPYPIAKLGLAVESLEPQLAMDPNTRYLRLWEEPTDSWKLRLQVEIPDDAAERVLPEAERGDPPLEVAVTLRSASSRLREAITFEFSAGTAEHELVLESSRWCGLIELDASLVRTRDALDVSGHFATRAHTVVGRADQVRIDVDEQLDRRATRSRSGGRTSPRAPSCS